MAYRSDNPNYLLIGLGGTGGKILKEFKKRLFLEHSDDTERAKLKPAVTFLYVDSTNEMMNENRKDPSWRVMGKDATFTQSEFLPIKSDVNGISQILDNIENYPGLRHIVKNGNAMRTTLGEIGAAAGQKRRAGRIMFASNCARFLDAVRGKYSELQQKTKMDTLHVYVFTGLAGGTGSGSIIDVVAQLRKTYKDAEIDVYAMVPELNIPPGYNVGRYHQNGYAALRELSALNIPGGYRPSDVMTGDEHIAFETEDQRKQFGLVLFSDVNENGVKMNTTKQKPEYELHKNVADTVYFSIFLARNANTDEYFRAWSCENRNDYLVEYSTKAKAGDKVPKRTKAISTFGIKRIIYPENRIMEHISYTLSERIIWQMHYNNFKEEGEGYINEPIHKDYSEFTKNEGVMREWRLDDSHLMLNEKILESDKKVDTFDAFWDNIVGFYNYEDAKANDSEPLRYLEQYCEDQFNHQFRLKQGVDEYFSDKSADRVLREQAQFVVESIEKHLYTQWYEGKYSMADLMGICEQVLLYLKQKIDRNEEEVSKIEEDINTFTDDKVANNDVFNHMGLIKRAAGGSSRCYSDHQAILKDLYTARTRKVAKQFQGKLMLRLRSLFEDFQQQMNDFVGQLMKSEDQLVKLITDRTRRDTKLDMSKTIVEVSEDDKMVTFEEKLERDKTKMDSLAAIMRHKLVKNQTYAHFGDLAAMIDENTVTDIADQYLAEQIKAYHADDDDFRRDKIIDINVLQELQKQLRNNPELDVNMFAKQVIDQCGVLLKLNGSEITKFMPNNPNPNNERASIDQKCMLISLPNYEGDDKLKEFAHQLEAAFKSATSAEKTQISFDHSGNRKNEITIVEVRYLFPVRCLDSLPQFRKEYLELVDDKNEGNRKQNQILLHSEGDGNELPELEGEGDGPKGQELLAYFFLAVASGVMAWGHNEQEERGWCYVKVDPTFGTKEVKLISPRFTGIVNSEELTPDIKNGIIDKVDELLKNQSLTVSQRKTIANRIVIVVQKQIVNETSGTTSPLFKEYAGAAKLAIEKIQK